MKSIWLDQQIQGVFNTEMWIYTRWDAYKTWIKVGLEYENYQHTFMEN